MIDIQPFSDFEAEYSAIVDALERWRTLEPPAESEGMKGIARWFNEFHRIALTITSLPNPSRLTEFAEELDRTLANMAERTKSGTDEKTDPEDGELLDEPEILYGKPTGAFSSGATVTIAPCDINGTATGEDNVTVYLKADKSSYTMSNSTTIPTTEIIPFVAAGDYLFYVLGRPKVVMTNFQVVTASQLLQKKTRDDWGTFCGTESDWVTVHTGDVCA